MKALWIAAVCGALCGCYKNVGPVITDVRLDHDGALHYTKCDLVVGRSYVNVGDDDFENCVNESKKAVDSPTPPPER